MATRCNIILEDKDFKVQLYRHFDGYPEGMIPDLHGVFKNKPPKSAMEGSEAILREWKYDDGKPVAEFEGNVDNYEDELHGDIEYLYIIQCMGMGIPARILIYNMGYGHNGSLGDKQPEAIIPLHYLKELLK